MTRTKVLLADDAVVVRRMLTDVLATDPTIEVAGAAANGKILLAKIPQVNPDIVILDVEMPEMDGLETLAALRKIYRKLPVIMFSTLTQRGAAATIEALALGANDYVTKPANVGSVAAAMQSIREQLIPKIKIHAAQNATPPNTGAAFAGSVTSPPPFLPQKGSKAPMTTPRSTSRVDMVVIGVSTGGPNALAALLPEFTADFPVPICIVQHMPPLFTKFLADRLAANSALDVKEGVAGATCAPGQVWIAPGDYHMEVERNALTARLRLHQGPQENSCRPAVDVLFRSAVRAFGPAILGVILTGMGKDGLAGCEEIRQVGGQILAQDEPSSVVWGMPGFVARAGLADQVLPLSQLGAEINRRVRKGRLEASRKQLCL